MYQFSEEQIRYICDVFDKMLALGREHFFEMDKLCDADYLKGRIKYPISALVYSGFDLEHQNMPDFEIRKTKYGKGRAMPEFINSDAIVQLYSNTANPYKTEEVKSKIKQYGDSFHIIEYEVSDDSYELKSLILVSFDGIDEDGRVKVGKRQVLFQRN